MIPVKLSLQNFMSYGLAEISFAGIHTACLSGNNGNGKSALLDAMTWALWGQARGVEKNGAGMDDLVRLGCENMAVEFSFSMDERQYRIIRKRDKRRQISALELHISDGEKFRSISGDRLGETQDKLNQILKLDYETFTNSAFILQGKADSFTTQKPGDRKRILAEILGLSYYDRLERKARDKMNEADAVIRACEGQLQHLAGELSQEPVVRFELENCKNSKLATDANLRVKEKELEELARQIGELQGLDNKRGELAGRIELSLLQVQAIDRQIRVLEGKINGLKELLAREAEIAAGYQRLVDVRAAEETEAQKQARTLELLPRKAKLEGLLSEAKAKLQSELAGLQSEKNQLRLSLARSDAAAARLPQLEMELAQLREAEQARLRDQEELLRLRSERAAKEQQLSAVQREITELRDKYKTLQSTGAHCPLCQSELRGTQKTALLQDLHNLGSGKRAELEEIQQALKDLLNGARQVETRLAADTQKAKSQVESNLQLAQRDLADGQQAAAALQALAEREQILNSNLEQQTFAPAAREELVRVVQELQELAYDQTKHQTMRALHRELHLYADQYSSLNNARSGLPVEEDMLNQLLVQKDRELAEINNHKETINLLQTQVARLPELERGYQQVKTEVAKLREQKSQLEGQIGALTQKLAHLVELKHIKDENLTRRDKAAQHKQLFSQLVTAFGKKGIQAMIIENAIPEIQTEANNLLARITDGRMHLALLTQRDTKKGSVAETLDIRIADEMGTRKYEMYSGGEAFRVNFALRIALSKFLARRAGAKLQTLVIDEGFGTQDGSGKERLIEIINAIKDDFARIIVVTHIQELKDAFPVQIEVEKTAAGSSLRLV